MYSKGKSKGKISLFNAIWSVSNDEWGGQGREGAISRYGKIIRHTETDG